MQKLLKNLYALAIVVVVVIVARKFFGGQTTKVAENVAQRAGVGDAAKHLVALPAEAARFTEVPGEKLLASDTSSRRMYEELSARYRDVLGQIKSAVEGDGATLVVVTFGTELGKYASPIEKRGQPVVRDAARALGLPYFEATDSLVAAADRGVKISQMPKDGHLSRDGAAIVASFLATVVRKYDGVRSTKVFTASERPATFGDLAPNKDGIEDIGNGLPYVLKSNAQGLRMDYDLAFPKTKQRVLILGNSTAFFPFLDNGKTGTALLQREFPDKEILNAAMWAYSPLDELSLFTEKTRYAEPDLVILQQGGDDIVNLFFTHVNMFDRKKEYHGPSPLERAYYDFLTAK
jgi:hypothetical protein